MSEGEKAFIKMMEQYRIQMEMYAKNLPAHSYTSKDVRFVSRYGTTVHQICEESPSDR